MFDMQPLTPLGGRSAFVETHGPVTVAEVTETALASYAARLGREAEARAGLSSFIDGAVPGPGKATQGDVAAVWLGVDQWMVMAPYERHQDLAAHLAQTADGAASVTEQTDAWCRFDLSGAGLADVFERLCAMNLRAATPGDATRTSIDHLGCLVILRAMDHISVLGPRSSAGSLCHALLTAVRAAL